jgi:hypothetical protein
LGYFYKKTIRQTLVNNLTKLLYQYGLRNLFFTYVKDNVSNLNAMTTALKSIIKYEVLGLGESFHGTCFVHVFSKACQYAITNENICKNLQFISIKSTQSNLHKCITWPKKPRKGRQEHNKTCLNFNIHPRKLNIPIKTR